MGNNTLIQFLLTVLGSIAVILWSSVMYFAGKNDGRNNALKQKRKNMTHEELGRELIQLLSDRYIGSENEPVSVRKALRKLVNYMGNKLPINSK